MNTEIINCQLSQFNIRFNGDLHGFMGKREKRQAIFDKWIALADKEEVEVRPYARLIVCSQIVKKAIWGDSDEIAHYMSFAIDDIQYALNTECDPNRNRYTPILHIQGRRHDSFIFAIVKEFTPEQVSKYLDAVVDVHLVETRFSYALYTLLYAVRGYIKVEGYDQAIKLGDKALTLYDNHPADYGCYKQDTTSIVDLIKVEICNAHNKLGTASEQMQAEAQELKAKEEKRVQDEADWRAAKKSELMSLAEECRAAGDMQGYYGYMSAMGDVGR